MTDAPEEHDPDRPVSYPVDGVLDLHTFNPSDLGTLVDEFIYACLEKKIYHIRIIHGKGTGALRKSVHNLLERNRYVQSYGTDSRSWGATAATLVPDDSKDRDTAE